MDTHGTKLYNLWRKQRRRRLIVVLALIVVLVMAFVLYLNTTHTSPTSSTKKSPASSSQSGKLEKGTPTYRTFTPNGAKVDWTRISPPDHNAVYTYTDTVKGVAIAVSEQPLPDSFKADSSSKIEELARSYNANRFITVGTAKVFIGTSVKGPQSLILLKESILILIKSSTTLNDDQWTSYIGSLK